MSKGKSQIRKICPFHQVDTSKIAASQLIEYQISESRKGNRAMAEINNRLKDLVLSYKPNQIKYQILDYNEIATKSNRHNNFYPKSYETIIPISPDKNASKIIENLEINQSYNIQKLVMRHKFHYETCKSHAKATDKVMKEITSKLNENENPYPHLSLQEVQNFIEYQMIQERPDSAEPIILFNEIMKSRPDIVVQILRVQSQIFTVLKELLESDEQLKHEDLAFSEIGYIDDGVLYPNSRFLKIVTNNLGQFFHRYKQKTANEILYDSSLDAEKNGLFNQHLFLFDKKGDNYRLKEVDNKACPAVKSIGPMIRHLCNQPA